MVKNLSLLLGSLVALVLGALCNAANAGALALWDDPAQALAVVTPNGINVLPAWQYTAPTADGAGGAFVNGVEALTLDGQVADIAVSGLASESAIAAAAATVAPAALFAAAAFAGLDLAVQGLSLSGTQAVQAPSSGPLTSAVCADGAAVVWQIDPATAVAQYSAQVRATYVLQSIVMDSSNVSGTLAQVYAPGEVVYVAEPTAAGYYGVPKFYQGLGPYGYSCSDGSAVGGATIVAPSPAPATPAQIQTDVENALSAKPSAAPTFAQKLSDLGYPPSIVLQTPTGPASVKGPATTTTSSQTTSGGTTTSTQTCTPTDSFSYGPGSISVTRTSSCTTQTSGPQGSSSSASTTTTPPTQSSSGAVTPFTPPLTSFPSSSSPSGTVALPTVSVPASSGTCPQPITFVVFGVTYSISLTPLCTLAGEIQPFVIGINGLAAALFILRGV